MNRLMRAICVVVLSATALAQHHPRHSGTASKSQDNADQDLQDFNRAVALQATPEQAAQFQMFVKDTLEARKAAQSLVETSQQPGATFNVDPLADAVEDLEEELGRFVAGLSAPQKAGLKAHTKKLTKADGELVRDGKALRNAGHSNADPKEIPALAQKIDEALSEFQSEQAAIAAEIGTSQQSSPD